MKFHAGNPPSDMSSFTEDQFEKKLLALKDTHEGISSLSAWCLEHHPHHKKIVSTWLQVLKKGQSTMKFKIKFILLNTYRIVYGCTLVSC